ncbi:transposase [Splendidivirga corallicola]|uniref:transposase n=1 Tax=Splendidivirga corallicola TaxID=3051826 RepID=UPI0032119B25
MFIDLVSSYHDHCHCLVSPGTDQTMSKVIQLIKRESSTTMICVLTNYRFPMAVG